MGSRLLFSAFVALAAFAFSAESRADDGGHSKHHPHLKFYNGHPVGGYFGYLGGGYYRYGIPTPFAASQAYNYPGFYNNQTFWERVVTQRNYPVQY
jgi:hypothetical protein